MGEISKGAQCFRVLFIISNLIFLALGLTVLGIGIWLVVEANEFGETLTGDGYVAGGALLIVCGIVTIFVTVIGIIGACGLWRPLLVIYIFLVVLICILEIAAGVIGFIFSEEISDEIDERMRDAIEDYRAAGSPGHQEDVNDAVEFVQDRFECCGADNYTDWEDLNSAILCTNMAFPDCTCDLGEDGCINVTVTVECDDPATNDTNPFNQTFTTTVWDTGCSDEVRDALEGLSIILGGIGIAFGVFEVLTILVALGLFCCITMSRKQTVV